MYRRYLLFLLSVTIHISISEVIHKYSSFSQFNLNATATISSNSHSNVAESEGSITSPPIAVATSSRDCKGVTVNGVNVNAYTWGSIYTFDIQISLPADECTSNPNTILGKPPAFTLNSSDPNAPATLPVYRSFVETSIGESINTVTLSFAQVTYNTTTVLAYESPKVFTSTKWSTISGDPAQTPVTATISSNDTL